MSALQEFKAYLDDELKKRHNPYFLQPPQPTADTRSAEYTLIKSMAMKLDHILANARELVWEAH